LACPVSWTAAAAIMNHHHPEGALADIKSLYSARRRHTSRTLPSSTASAPKSSGYSWLNLVRDASHLEARPSLIPPREAHARCLLPPRASREIDYRGLLYHTLQACPFCILMRQTPLGQSEQKGSLQSLSTGVKASPGPDWGAHTHTRIHIAIYLRTASMGSFRCFLTSALRNGLDWTALLPFI
jgi:hypothetical protein